MGAFLLDVYDLYYESLNLYIYGVLKRRRKKNQHLFQALFSQEKYLVLTFSVLYIFYFYFYLSHWLEFLELHVLLLTIFCLSFWIPSAFSSGVSVLQETYLNYLQDYGKLPKRLENQLKPDFPLHLTLEVKKPWCHILRVWVSKTGP